jgi:hypothetical protein
VPGFASKGGPDNSARLQLKAWLQKDTLGLSFVFLAFQIFRNRSKGTFFFQPVPRHGALEKAFEA